MVLPRPQSVSQRIRERFFYILSDLQQSLIHSEQLARKEMKVRLSVGLNSTKVGLIELKPDQSQGSQEMWEPAFPGALTCSLHSLLDKYCLETVGRQPSKNKK